MGADMLLPKIKTSEMEKIDKKMEMIGARFRKDLVQAAMVIEIEYYVNTAIGLADTLEQYFPKFFKMFEKRIEDEWEEWCDKYDAECDPPMDKYHYLRTQA